MFTHPRIPQVCDTNWSKVQTILDLPSVLFLNAILPSELQGEWRLIFSNALHGDSFSQLAKILEGRGPSLLVLHDRQGHVFGGFASQPWHISPKFYGELCWVGKWVFNCICDDGNNVFLYVLFKSQWCWSWKVSDILLVARVGDLDHGRFLLLCRLQVCAVLIMGGFCCFVGYKGQWSWWFLLLGCYKSRSSDHG